MNIATYNKGQRTKTKKMETNIGQYMITLPSPGVVFFQTSLRNCFTESTLACEVFAADPRATQLSLATPVQEPRAPLSLAIPVHGTRANTLFGGTVPPNNTLQ